MGQGGSGQGGDAGGLNVEMSMGPDGVMSALHIPAEECNYAWVNNFTFMNHLVSKKVFSFPAATRYSIYQWTVASTNAIKKNTCHHLMWQNAAAIAVILPNPSPPASSLPR